MKELFTQILNISITAGVLIVVCILVRLFFRNMPKYVRCLMWLIVAVRLVIPFSIESSLSMLPAKEYVTVEITGNQTTNIDYYSISDASSIGVMDILAIVWGLGVAATLIYAIAAYLRLRRMVSDAVILRENIYQSEKVGTAFVLGIISPKIYIPYGLGLGELYMAVNHERAHIARRDHLVKPLGFIIASIYWFNPLVWAAYILLCRDIELACDEKVIKKIGYDKKKDYSQALLNLSIPRKYISACPVAFGELGVNERVKNVLKMKKGKKIILVAALAVCGIIAIGFLTYPKSDGNEDKAAAAITEEAVKSEAASEIETTESTTAVETDKTTKAENDSTKDETEAAVTGNEDTTSLMVNNADTADLVINNEDKTNLTIKKGQTANIVIKSKEITEDGNVNEKTNVIEITGDDGLEQGFIDEDAAINVNAVEEAEGKEVELVVIHKNNDDKEVEIYFKDEKTGEISDVYVYPDHDDINGEELESNNPVYIMEEE